MSNIIKSVVNPYYPDKLHIVKYERTDDDQTILTCRCIVCKKDKPVTVQSSDLYRWLHGASITVAFPKLSNGEREQLISGTCEPCFDRVFGGKEEEEQDLPPGHFHDDDPATYTPSEDSHIDQTPDRE